METTSSSIPTRITLGQWHKLNKKLSKNNPKNDSKKEDPIDILVESFKSMDLSIFNFIDFVCTDESDQKLRELILEILAVDCKPQVMDWLSTIDFIISCKLDALIAATAYGNLEILKWYYSHFESSVLINVSRIVHFAIVNGHTDILDWVGYNISDPIYNSKSVDLAVDNGHLKMLKYLYEYFGCNIHYTDNAMYYAAYNNHIHIMDWIYDKKLPLKYSFSVIDSASFNGHYDVIDWFIERKLKLKYTCDTIRYLIHHFGFNILTKILTINPRFDQLQQAFEIALRESDHKVLDWFKNNKQYCRCDEKLLLEAYECKDKKFIENIINYEFND